MSELATDATRRLVDHLRRHAVRTDGPFTLSSGSVSDWYIDARQTTFSGAGARAVGDAVLSVLDPAVEAVGGMTMGADPIALATAMRAGEAGRAMVAFSIRKAAKDHGTGGRLVGPVAAPQPVAIVDDTVTTGGAFVESIEVALEAGLDVRQVVALVDRSGPLFASRMASMGLPYRVLVTVGELGVGP